MGTNRLFFQLNVGGVGFYRTHYPADMLESLLPAIRNRTLSPRDRLALENDLFALVLFVLKHTIVSQGSYILKDKFFTQKITPKSNWSLFQVFVNCENFE